MKNLSTKFLALFFLGIFTWGCEDDAMEANRQADLLSANENSQSQANQTTGSKLLKNMKVTGDIDNGGTFDGMVTITEFSYDETKGLLASGEIKGIATDADGNRTHVKETFENIEATLGNTPASGARLAAQQAECQILFLELGPLFLDVLGLQVDLSQIVLDITAVSGAGNLLGNLLCAVAGLLDPLSGLLELLENLGQLLDLLEQINDLLG